MVDMAGAPFKKIALEIAQKGQIYRIASNLA